MREEMLAKMETTQERMDAKKLAKGKLSSRHSGLEKAYWVLW
jgi:hypothetical protein